MIAEPRSTPRRFAVRLPYQRQQTVSLLVVAVLPLAILGLLAFDRIAAAVNADADERIRTAVRGVEAALADAEADLAREAAGYAGSDLVVESTAALDVRRIESDLIAFQVDRGAVDGVVLAVGEIAVSGGDPAVVARLAAAIDPALGVSPSGSDIGPAYLALPGGVYHVVIARIDLTGRSGPGVEAARRRPAVLAFARRIGSPLVLGVKRLIGFDVAIFDAAGGLTVASDVGVARAVEVPAASLLPPGGERIHELEGRTVAATAAIRDRSGAAVGALVVSTDLAVLAAIRDDLVPRLAVLLALTTVVALGLALALSRRLHLRLEAVASGISAVAAGDLSGRLPAADRDILGRLAASRNQLATALERRDRMLRRSLAALSRLTPDRGREAIAQAAVEAARDAFGLDACWLRDGDGFLVASEPDGGDDLSAEVSVPMPLLPYRLEARISDAGGTWSEADHAILGLYARQLDAALRDAAIYEEASHRAERLARLNRLQGDFLRGVSHNLQSPLTRILTLADDLGSAPSSLDGFARERIDVIRAESDRLARLVEQLLTLSRIEAGRFRPEAELLKLAPIAQRAWEAHGSDRSFRIDDGSGGALALADRGAVEQVFWILFDNALRYAPAGSIRVGIRRRQAKAPRQPDGARRRSAAHDRILVVRVEDDGPGVPPEERARIFRRFQRGSTGRGHEGSGLGLNVARGMLRAMGGGISYEARDGGGATFVFTLPAESGDPPG